MHYINGREAKENDLVIHKDSYTPKFTVGTVFQLSAQSKTCNAQLVSVKLGGVNYSTVTLADCLHVEDAWNAQWTLAGEGKPTTQTVTPDDGSVQQA